jgi:hypothetical protein
MWRNTAVSIQLLPNSPHIIEHRALSTRQRALDVLTAFSDRPTMTVDAVNGVLYEYRFRASQYLSLN